MFGIYILKHIKSMLFTFLHYMESVNMKKAFEALICTKYT